MTDLEKLYKEKLQERQDYLRDLAVYQSKMEEAINRVKSLEKEILANVDNLRPDIKDIVLKAMERPDEDVISREYFDNMRKLFKTLESIGIKMLNNEV